MLPINEIYTCIQGEGPLAGKPHILIRTLGCPLRCQFKESFCDTSLNSWSPEKSSKEWEDIFKIVSGNPHIDKVMITGGSPTMHPELVSELSKYLLGLNKEVTLETEGINFIKIPSEILVSISPKLSTSTPKVGSINPYTKQKVTSAMAVRHERLRYNPEAIKFWMKYQREYWFKFVVTSREDLEEIERDYVRKLHIPRHRVYLMPEGVEDSQFKDISWIVDECLKKGYNYSDRLHIRIYGDKRMV